MKILLLNGPPGCGKDTLGAHIADDTELRVHVLKFAGVLKTMTHALYGLVDEDGNPRPHDFFEGEKERPQGSLFGVTPRNAYIAVSEKLMKPLHGVDIFGKMLSAQISLVAGVGVDLIVVTDSGFSEEAQVLVRNFPQAVTLVRIHRPDCTYKGDSRSYIELPGTPTYDIDNDMDLGTFYRKWDDFLRPKLFPTFDSPAISIEVQLPFKSSELVWIPVLERSTLDRALASVEALRRGQYPNRAIRLRSGKQILKLIMPGDAPVAEIQ